MFTAYVLAATMQPNVEMAADLSRPAEIAGPWEALVAPGEIAGFSLLITTNANGTVQLLRLDTYVRKQGKTSYTWWSSDEPGTLAWTTGRLQFNQSHSAPNGTDVRLDLTYDAVDDAWNGSFSNPSFSGHAVLHRPRMRDAMAPAGTWRTYSQMSIWGMLRVQDYGCVNIGVGADGALVIWVESHNIFLGYDDAKRPIFGDSYGELYDDSHATRYVDEWSFVSGTNAGGDRITGALSSDGAAFGGYSEHYGNGIYDPSHPHRAFAWTRMFDFACRP